MKIYSLLLLILTLSAHSVEGRIKNAYENQVSNVRESLKCLTDLLSVDQSMTASQRKTIKARIEVLVNYLACYKLTNNLLSQFKTISPDIYHQTDSIKDAMGRPTDVYVKFILSEDAEIMAAGSTYMSQTEKDKDGCLSEYGEQTVLVKVWIFAQALVVLSHEFGHVNYQVPHLANYTSYYRSNYGTSDSESNNIGHEPDDLSGKNADLFERNFKHDYGHYLRMDVTPAASPMVLVQDIRKKIYLEMSGTWLATL